MGSSMCTISDDSSRPIPYAQRNHYDQVKYKNFYSSKTVTKYKHHHGKRTSQRSHHRTTKRRDESSAGAPDNSLIPVDDSVGYLS